MSFKEDPLEQISFTQDDILLQGLPQIKSQGINNSSKQESQVQNLNLDLQSRSKRHESIGRILEEKTQPISKMQDYQQNQQTFESAASQRMNIGITQQHQRSNGGSSKEDLRRNMNEAFSENLPTIKSKSKSQSQNTELKMKIQELQKINRIKRGLNNIEDSYDDGSLERSTNKSNKNNKIKPGNTNIGKISPLKRQQWDDNFNQIMNSRNNFNNQTITLTSVGRNQNTASTMSKDNLISINSLSASKKFNSNLNTSQIVKPQHKNRPLNILQDDRYSKERLLETAYNLNDEINQQTPISEVAQNQVKHQQDKSYLDSPNKTLLSFKKQSNISDKVNESFLSFDNESTILAISKISQKGQSNNSSFIGGRQSNRKILPQLPSNFNENSNNDFIDPIKVNIKYKNIIQNGEKTQRNHQSRKEHQARLKMGIDWSHLHKWCKTNLKTQIGYTRIFPLPQGLQEILRIYLLIKIRQASKKKLLESKEQLNGSQSPSQNLFTPLRDPCDQKLLCSSIGQSRSISPKVFTNLGKRSDSIVSQMKLKNGLDPNGRSPGSIKKPPPFKLKDLHKYSKTLKVTDIDPMLFNRVLDSKNKNKGRQSKSPPQNNQQSPPRSPNRNIEWTKTPVYKQFMLKLTEMESLEDNQIGFRKHKMRNPKKTLKQFELDLKNKKLMYQLMEEVLSNIYTEQEVQYFITILKNKNLNDDEMVSMWIKVGDTLEVLMCKLGLKDQYDRMMDQYDEEKKDNLRKTIIKLLCRCKIMFGLLSENQEAGLVLKRAIQGIFWRQITYNECLRKAYICK
eukprot:403341723